MIDRSRAGRRRRCAYTQPSTTSALVATWETVEAKRFKKAANRCHEMLHRFAAFYLSSGAHVGIFGSDCSLHCEDNDASLPHYSCESGNELSNYLYSVTVCCGNYLFRHHSFALIEAVFCFVGLCLIGSSRTNSDLLRGCS